MAFGETLYTKLSNNAGLTALVGTRIYPVKLRQQHTLPAIRYTRISSNTPSAMGSDIGITDYTYQFDVFAATYNAADDVLVKLKAALQRWRTSGVQDSFIISESDLSYEDELDIYRIRIDFRFFVDETFS